MSSSRARSFVAIAIAIATFMWSESGIANAPREMSIDEKIRASSLVMVGTVEEAGIQPVDNQFVRMARVRVDGVTNNRSSEPNLKAGDEIQVMYRTGGAESNADWCCKKGYQYMLFLAQVDKGSYRSVNGPFGFYYLCNRKRCAK
jgi:hypothetical protein